MQMVTEENTDVDEFEDVEIVNVSEPRYLKKEREARKKYLILYLENGSDKEHFHVKKNAEDAENRRIQKGAEVKKIDLIGLYTSSTDISDLENIVIISHGEQISPKKTDNKFAECTAKQLADDIFFHIKKEGELIKYQGEIFLDGCYTGEPIKKLYDGTSYAERFGQALKKNITDYNEKLSHGEANLGLYFTVKGNLGSAIIQDDGRQMVILDEHNKHLFEQNAPYSNHPSQSYEALREYEMMKKKEGQENGCLFFSGSMGKAKYEFHY